MAFLFDKLANVPQVQLGLIAVVFVMAGLCFRVAAVPLHFYAPDVYQGSPIAIAAALAWVPKAVGFLAIMRALTAVLATKDSVIPLLQQAVMLAWVIAAATMIWGNFVALLQENLKRLLAYSSIAHAGYMMVGVTAAFSGESHGGGMYYGSEGSLLLPGRLRPHDPGGLRRILRASHQRASGGNGRRPVRVGLDPPLPALALSICLLSLSGIPPLVGFWAKFEIFSVAAGRRPACGVGFVHRAGGHRHAERGRRRVLLPPARRRHVFASRQSKRSRSAAAGPWPWPWVRVPASLSY